MLILLRSCDFIINSEVGNEVVDGVGLWRLLDYPLMAKRLLGVLSISKRVLNLNIFTKVWNEVVPRWLVLLR